MVRKQIHSQSLLVINGGVGMVKALVEINDIDNGDDVADVLHGADDYAMNGTFVARKVLR